MDRASLSGFATQVQEKRAPVVPSAGRAQEVVVLCLETRPLPGGAMVPHAEREIGLTENPRSMSAAFDEWATVPIDKSATRQPASFAGQGGAGAFFRVNEAGKYGHRQTQHHDDWHRVLFSIQYFPMAA
jgi:hypothetical protein